MYCLMMQVPRGFSHGCSLKMLQGEGKPGQTLRRGLVEGLRETSKHWSWVPAEGPRPEWNNTDTLPLYRASHKHCLEQGGILWPGIPAYCIWLAVVAHGFRHF